MAGLKTVFCYFRQKEGDALGRELHLVEYSEHSCVYLFYYRFCRLLFKLQHPIECVN